MESLAVLAPGSVFERFAVVLIEQLHDITLVQRGSSVTGSPVGGALDAVSEDSRAVVEASIVKGYFSGQMAKPWGDLEHALDLAPRAQDVYLLSSQRAETGKIEGMVNEALGQARMSGRRLHLMDSRAIAEAIVDTLMLRDGAIDKLSVHLPVLSDIRDDHPASLTAAPLSENYLPNTAVDMELDRLLETKKCVEITGIGGIGKSQAAAACLARAEGRFHYRFWVSGRDIDGIERLSAVPLRRGGAERNVSALLRRERTMLVLDDANARLDPCGLANLCGPDSRVVITRQHSSPGAFAMPLMDEHQARTLLTHDVASQLSDKAFRTIWRTVGGHPLTLTMLNAAAREGSSWNELANECAHVAKFQLHGARLADSVLGRLRPALEEELSLFQWADQSNLDRAFFEHVIGSLRMRAFERHGLTAPEGKASIRIHDIVFTALKSLDWLTTQRSRAIDGHLEAFIVKQIRDDGHGLQLIASQLRAKIRRNVENGDRRPAYLYALAMTWSGGAIPVQLLPDPIQEAKRLSALSARENEVAILVVLETIEAKARFLKHTMGEVAVTSWLNSVMQAYGALAGMADQSARQVAEIKHHQAKVLRTLGRDSEAEELFQEVVASYPLNDAKLQLVRSLGLRPEGYAAAKQYATDIIAAKLEDAGVSPSLLLALGDTLNLARKTWAGELLDQHEEMFLGEALYSAGIGVPQGYHSLANFVRALIWHAPERVEGVLARLPEPTPLMLDDDQSRGAYAEIMMIAAQASENETYLSQALQAFETLQSPNAYQRRKWGETLYRLDRFIDAEAILETISDDPGRPWLAHNLSQVKLALGKLPEALALIDESVTAAVGANERYRSSFLLQRIKVKRALQLDASADIAEAFSFTKHPGLLKQISELDG